jgi:aldose 1-epimerase
MIRLGAGDAILRLDPDLGGRIASLTVDGHDLIVPAASAPAGDPLGWGCYPLVPFAGRIRGGRLAFEGSVHDLPLRDGRHALHGTVDTAEWDVLEVGDATALLGCDLGASWPFAGRVEHRIDLSADGLRLELDMCAHEDMPAQIGWHPWFPRPAQVRADFTAWLPRDEDGMPTTSPVPDVPPLDDGVDDCFVAPAGPVRVETAGLVVTLTSDCSHWVVYTGADHGVCVEPQSGPPNESENAPHVVRSGGNLRRWFTMEWESASCDD